MIASEMISGSSTISFVSYDYDKKELTIRFTSGRKYCYADVAEEVFKGFVAAESKGKFFNSNIKHEYAWQEVQ